MTAIGNEYPAAPALPAGSALPAAPIASFTLDKADLPAQSTPEQSPAPHTAKLWPRVMGQYLRGFIARQAWLGPVLERTVVALILLFALSWAFSWLWTHFYKGFTALAVGALVYGLLGGIFRKKP